MHLIHSSARITTCTLANKQFPIQRNTTSTDPWTLKGRENFPDYDVAHFSALTHSTGVPVGRHPQRGCERQPRTGQHPGTEKHPPAQRARAPMRTSPHPTPVQQVWSNCNLNAPSLAPLPTITRSHFQHLLQPKHGSRSRPHTYHSTTTKSKPQHERAPAPSLPILRTSWSPERILAGKLLGLGNGIHRTSGPSLSSAVGFENSRFFTTVGYSLPALSAEAPSSSFSSTVSPMLQDMFADISLVQTAVL